MDSKLKGLIMSGMAVSALLFALIAVLGPSWATADVDTGNANYGLSEYEIVVFGLTITGDFSEQCEDGGDDEVCSLATAGTVGAIGLWIGILLVAAFAAMLILRIAGIDVMDERIPDMAKMAIQWGAGAMILLGAIGWLILKPELEDDFGIGISFWMAILAGILALGASAMDTFVVTDDK